MNTKKLIALIMTFIMGATLAACGSTDNGADTDADNKVYNIGICQLTEHEALDDATQGFKDALVDLLGEDGVTFNEQNGQGEQAMCSTIVNNFISENVDLILANGTLPLQVAAQATADIPILGTSITDYGTALGITDWTGTTGVNVSGTSDLTPIAQQEDMILELFPDTQKVAIIYCSAEPNSAYQVDIFKEECEADNLAYGEYPFADSNEMISVLNAAVAECDVVYVPTDNTVVANAQLLKDVCFPANVPVVASDSGTCAIAAVATLSGSYYGIGYRSGEMAYEVLVNGADISSMEIEYSPEVTKLYNKENCEYFNITVPEDYVELTAE